MKQYRYTIEPEIFHLHPGYVRGVVVAYNSNNISSSNEHGKQLRLEEELVRAHLDINRIAEDEHFSNWREAFRRFGAKPSEYRSSVEAMVRRILHNDSLPNINPLVDIGNIISLRYLIPVGGHAIDHLKNDIHLKVATGEELFNPHKSKYVENPSPGEIIFAEGNSVLTRRWTWRQGTTTLIESYTTAILYNLDGLPPVGKDVIIKASHELMGLIGEYCHGGTELKLLTAETPSFTLTLK